MTPQHPAVSPDISDSVARFEAWAVESKRAYRCGSGVVFYPGEHETALWRGWQAALATSAPPPSPAGGAVEALRRLERAVDMHLGRSSWTQTTHLKGLAYSEAVRKELYAAHDDARAAISAAEAVPLVQPAPLGASASQTACSVASLPEPEVSALRVPPAGADTLCRRLQQQCSDWGVYWRAPDSHGVDLSLEQAVDLLRTALCVEVEIKGLPPEAYAVGRQDEIDEWLPFALTVEHALNRGDDPSLLFDENSPIRDELRNRIAAARGIDSPQAQPNVLSPQPSQDGAEALLADFCEASGTYFTETYRPSAKTRQLVSNPIKRDDLLMLIRTARGIATMADCQRVAASAPLLHFDKQCVQVNMVFGDRP